MTNQDAINAEYARIRKLHIRDLRSLAATLLEEVAVLEGTDFLPQSHWKPSIPALLEQATKLHTLGPFVESK